MADATAQSKSLVPPKSDLCTSFAYNDAVGLVDKEKVDIVNEVQETNSAELAKLRDDWDELTRRIHSLTAEADASQALARNMCFERDELRGMLDKKQTEIQAEDQNSMNEMQKLLAEFHNNGVGLDSSQKSPEEFVKQFAELTEKNAERLAKRAEVSERLSRCPDLVQFIPVKDLDKSRPFEPVAFVPAGQAPKKPEKGSRLSRVFGRKH